MDTLLLILICGGGYIIAYHTYGRFVAKKIFNLKNDVTVPSVAFKDGVDFVPTRKGIIFGHHYTSIAGTGPIVGPAIGIIWGWLPAMLRIFFGSIFMGAVHDFGAMVVSLRNQGKSISEAAAKYINVRVRFIFFCVVFLALLIVIAIFGVVIAAVFTRFPRAVIPVWLQIPIAIGLGYAVYKRTANVVLATAIAVGGMYISIVFGSYFPVTLGSFAGIPSTGIWVIILLVYAWVASTLPVTFLLQPRDYINAWQLFIAMALLVAGATIASLSGNLPLAAPALNHPAAPSGNVYVGNLAKGTTEDDLDDLFASYKVDSHAIIQDTKTGNPYDFALVNIPEDTQAAQAIKELNGQELNGRKLKVSRSSATPPIWPFLFVVIACGAISGFHSLVASGTSSKQVAKETDSLFVGYGSMLLEGFLATLVLVCVAAGIGMALKMDNGSVLTGSEAWRYQYFSWIGNKGLTDKIAPVVFGAANMMGRIGIPESVGITLMGVFIASFAGTTLDTSTRIQRYVISELASDLHIPFMTNRWTATTFAVLTAAGLAFAAGANGTGAMILWPLFGSANQLLAALALLVITLYLRHKGGLKYVVTGIPCLIMLVITSWSMVENEKEYLAQGNWLLLIIGAGISLLAVWMTVEALIVFKLKGAKEAQPEAEIEVSL